MKAGFEGIKNTGAEATEKPAASQETREVVSNSAKMNLKNYSDM